MCTNIVTKMRLCGGVKTDRGWFAVDEATMSFDHASRLWVEHALRLDLRGASAAGHVAVELDLASARRLRDELAGVIAEAERAGVST